MCGRQGVALTLKFKNKKEQSGGVVPSGCLNIGYVLRKPLKIRASGTQRVFFRHISQDFLPWGKPQPRNLVSSDEKILRRLFGAEYVEVPLKNLEKNSQNILTNRQTYAILLDS